MVATRSRSLLVAMLREEEEYHEIRDLFHLLAMARLGDTLVPELFEIAGKKTTFAILDLLAGETVVLPEAGVLETLVRKAAVHRVISDLPKSARGDRRTREWKNTVATLAGWHEVSRATIQEWFREVDALLDGTKL